MTMRPAPQMGPPRTPAAADQTTSGFAFAQATWDAYFDQSCALTLTTTGSGSEAGGGQPETETTFRVYTVGGLSLPDAAKGATARDFESVAPVYVLLHGGGLSSLSWALVAGALKRHGRSALAYDFRAHGGSTGSESELTAEQLCTDTLAVIEAVVGSKGPLVIVGHSLGGAIAAKVAGTPELKERVAAVAMIDIVESVAMGSLDKMEQMLARRPTSFASHHDAIQWATSTGMVSNPVSAAVSVPSLLRQQVASSTPAPAAPAAAGTGDAAAAPAAAAALAVAAGEGGADEEKERWVWRTDLRSTAVRSHNAF